MMSKSNAFAPVGFDEASSTQAIVEGHLFLPISPWAEDPYFCL